MSAATFGAPTAFAGFFAGRGDFFSATTVGFGGCNCDSAGGLGVDVGDSVGPASSTHAAATSTIEVHANTPPRINNCLRGRDVLAAAARVSLIFSAGRCDILVSQVYGMQNRPASRHSGLYQRCLRPIIRKHSPFDPTTLSRR